MSYDNDVSLTTTTETTIIAAPGANNFRDLLYLAAYNQGTNITNITLRDGTGGTVRAIMSLPAVASSGKAELRPVLPLRQALANKAWSVQLGTTSEVYVFAQTKTRKDAHG